MKPGQGDHSEHLSGVPPLATLGVGSVGPGSRGSVTHPRDPDFLLHPLFPRRSREKSKLIPSRQARVGVTHWGDREGSVAQALPKAGLGLALGSAAGPLCTLSHSVYVSKWR